MGQFLRVDTTINDVDGAKTVRASEGKPGVYRLITESPRKSRGSPR
jgi:hypothetical protein